MRRFAILPLLIGVPLTAAAQDSAAPPLTSAAAIDDAEEELQDLIDEFTDARAEFMEKWRAAETDEERQALRPNYPQPEAYADRFAEFAKIHKGTSHAAKALSWIVSNLRGGDLREEAMNTLVLDHVEDAAMVDVVRALMYDREEGTPSLLRNVIEKNSHPEVRGVASYVLGIQLKNRAESAPKEEKAQLLAEFEALMETCQKEYGKVELFPGYKTVAAAAEGDLFEHKHLQIGMVAPDIEGEDIDGVPFKLSDYRGKVIMLDFWGHW